MDLSNKNVVVVGVGKSGLGAMDLILAKGGRVRAVDEKHSEEICKRLASRGVMLCAQESAAFEAADLIVISPGVPADLPVLDDARAKGIKVTGEVELASHYLKGRIIGITGSNGKTTTTALAGHILHSTGIDCQVGGNIGTPPTAMIETSRDGRWNVLELSSFQLETIDHFQADIALALNVTDNHLDRHHTFENYAAAKARLFETQGLGSFAVLNADDRVCVSYATKTRAEVKWFSQRRTISSGAFLSDGIVFLEGAPLLPAADIPLRGRHNIDNVMAASIATMLAGAGRQEIAASIRTFPGVEHRLEFVRYVDGVAYFNDSKATSVDAALKAVDAFEYGLWIILGGKDKNSDYTVMRQPLRTKARGALLIGAAAERIAKQLDSTVALVQCVTLDEAVKEASRKARPGDTVLLAPACASFDQFQSYEHRGRHFKSLVNSLPEGKN